MSAAPVDQVIETFQKWLYLPKPEALLAVLGSLAANRMAGDPVWLLLVGPPGGGKSELLQATLSVQATHPAATMTERALLSGTARKERDVDAKGGLLREIGSYGILVCKDFGSILSMHREERARTLAALREVYDGSWTRHVGVDGGKTLHWTGKVGVIAGCTPSIDSHHAVMGAMGERFVLFRLPHADNKAQARRALSHIGRESEMRSELADAVKKLFSKAHVAPRTINSAEEERLIALATLVAKCRSSVERDSYNREIQLVPGSEAPTRLIIVLANILAGLDVIGVDRDQAWNVVTQIALDSMPRLRHDLLIVLYDAQDEVATSDIASEVRHPSTTTRRALEDLTAHYVIEENKQGQGKATLWRLADWANSSLNQALHPLIAATSDISGTPSNGTSPEMSYTQWTDGMSDDSSPTSIDDDITGKVNGTAAETSPIPAGLFDDDVPF